jgi:hypothetical protein
MPSFSVTIPTRVNIKKRLERIVYKTLTSQDEVNLAYVTSPDVTPETSLSIIDRSASITENRVLKNGVTLFSGKTFLDFRDKPAITGIFTTNSSTQGQVPLFFVHKLANVGSGTLQSVEFLDIDLKNISVSEYFVDSNLVYNNLVNSFDGQVAVVYYVKYTVKSGLVVTTYHELINNSPVYSVATYLDLDEWNNIIPGRKKYYAEQVVGEQYYEITLPQPGFYAHQESLTSKIKILPPEAVDNLSPWNIRISNGSFLTGSRVAGSPKVFKYYISEFDAQLFFPAPPFRQHIEDHASWINPRLAFIDRNIVLDDSLDFYLSIYVEDSTSLAKYAFTTDPTLVGTLWKDGIYYSDNIRSIDQQNGFIEVNKDLADTDIITATFYSAEDTFLFTEIDFNPVDNQEILRQRIVFYIATESADTGVLEQTLFYLVVDKLGQIVYCSQAILGNDPVPDANTLRMVTDDFNLDGTPKHTFYYNKPMANADYAVAMSYNFVNKYTVESTLLVPNSIPTTSVQTAYLLANPHYLVLGEVSVGEGSTVDNVSVYDVRVQGGGLKPEDFDPALRIQPEVMWYLDNSPLHPYPGVGAFYVQVPEEILSINGGRFSRDQILAIVEKHMKAGGYPILRTYGIDPVITDLNGTIISWPSYGTDVSFHVYISRGETGPWTELGSTVDNPLGNSYTLTGLVTGNNFARVGAVGTNGIESFSQTISVRVT